MKKILSLQGGGCLGIGHAVLLGEIEKQLPPNTSLASLWSMGGGTSVGAIVIACVSLGLPAKDILAFFQQDAPVIFGDSSETWWLTRPLACSQYDPTQLEVSLKRHLGNATLKDCRFPTLMTAVEMTTGRNVYFQSWGTSSNDEDEIVYGPDSDWQLWEICRASAAAESYFPGFVKDGLVFWDGGNTGCNAPDRLLLDELDDDANAAMLSVGHGRTKWPFATKDVTNPGYVGMLKAMTHVVFQGPEAYAVWSAKKALGDRHLRVNPALPRDFGIADASGPTQASEIATWLKAFDDNEQAICDLLFK